MKLFFPPILFLSMIFGGVKKGEESNGSISENFHDSRIIVKLKPETSFLNLYNEGQTQLTGMGSIDVLNRQYFCVKIFPWGLNLTNFACPPLGPPTA